MTYQEIEARMPDEFQARLANKLKYRYPMGESYEDLIQRCEPIVLEIEMQTRSTPVLVVGHQAVVRALYGYFADQDRTTVPFLTLPAQTVLQFESVSCGWKMAEIQIS